MRIRKFKEEDARKVSHLIRKTLIEVNIRDYPKSVIDNLVRNNSTSKIIERSKQRDIYVVADGEKILATANLGDDVIYTVFVNPNYHGKGIGRTLITFLEEKVKKKGYKVIQVPSSTTAYNFYKKLGYKKVRTKTSPEHGKVIIMKKKIQ